MAMHPELRAVAVCVLAAAGPAWAELDVVVANGDVVRGTLLPATQVETFRVACPAGARIGVTLVSVRSRRGVVAQVFDPAGAELASGAGRRVALRAVPAAASGEYRIDVSTADGLTSGDYRLRVVWRTPRRDQETIAVAGGASGTLEFAADAQAAVSLRVEPAPGSVATPSLLRVDGPDGLTIPLAAGTRAVVRPPVAGTYAVVFENTSAVAGDVVASASIRAPRRRTRRLAATSAQIPPGTDVLAAAVVGPSGGTLVVADGALEDAEVLIPPGALPRPAIVAIGAGDDLDPPKPADSTAATSAAFVGPLGTTFGGAARPRVTLPALRAADLAVGAGLVVYAAGPSDAVETVPGATYDGELVTFEPVRLTSFQGWFVEQPEVPVPFVAEEAGTRALGAIALGGGWAFVGSPYDPSELPAIGPGAVLVYERVGATWTLRQELQAPVPADADFFGSALAYRTSPAGAADDSILVGAEQQLPSGPYSVGKIHEFVLSDGVWVHRSTAGVPGKAGFGATFAVDGDRLVTPVTGEVLVLARDGAGWSLEQAVPATAWADLPIELDAATIVVGVPSDWSITYSSPPGSVYRLEPSGATWTQALRYGAPPPEVYSNQYGIDVALGSDLVAVAMPNAGATGAPDRPMDVLLHRRGDGAHVQTIERPIDPSLRGRSPVLTGRMEFRGDDTLFLVARADTTTFAGVYEYRRTDAGWERVRTFDAGPYLDQTSRTYPLTGALAVDGASLAFTVGAYDFDLRTTMYAAVFFEAP